MPAQKPEDTNRVTILDREAVVTAWIAEKTGSREMTHAEAEKKIKEYESDAKSYVSPVKDTAGSARLIYRLARDMKTWSGRVYFKSYGGQDYVIVKGYAGLRKILTAPRYKTTHPKVMEFQIGRPGLRAAAKESAVFGIILVSVIDVTDYFIRDNATLGELFGSLSMDISKVLIASAVGAAAGMLAVGVTAIASFAIGPLVVALAVGIVAGVVLDKIDEHFMFTERLSHLIDQGLAKLDRIRREIGHEAVERFRQFERSRMIADLSRDAERIWRNLGLEVEQARWRLSHY